MNYKVQIEWALMNLDPLKRLQNAHNLQTQQLLTKQPQKTKIGFQILKWQWLKFEWVHVWSL
jgi:hypothetical protein